MLVNPFLPRSSTSCCSLSALPAVLTSHDVFFLFFFLSLSIYLSPFPPPLSPFTSLSPFPLALHYVTNKHIATMDADLLESICRNSTRMKAGLTTEHSCIMLYVWKTYSLLLTLLPPPPPPLFDVFTPLVLDCAITARLPSPLLLFPIFDQTAHSIWRFCFHHCLPSNCGPFRAAVGSHRSQLLQVSPPFAPSRTFTNAWKCIARIYMSISNCIVPILLFLCSFYLYVLPSLLSHI
jgi:hypothetical protein